MPAQRISKECIRWNARAVELADQRRAMRYLISLDLTYAVLVKGKPVDSGVGRTIDFSSAGLRFVGERPVEAGLRLELAVRWPLTLEGGVPLKLVVSGEAIRGNERETVIRIVGYEFRTRSAACAVA